MFKVYSNGCPKCKILLSKLDDKNIQYEKSEDLQEIIDLGFKSVPILKVDEEYLEFGKAIKWIQDM